MRSLDCEGTVEGSILTELHADAVDLVIVLRVGEIHFVGANADNWVVFFVKLSDLGVGSAGADEEVQSNNVWLRGVAAASLGPETLARE